MGIGSLSRSTPATDPKSWLPSATLRSASTGSPAPPASPPPPTPQPPPRPRPATPGQRQDQLCRAPAAGGDPVGQVGGGVVVEDFAEPDQSGTGMASCRGGVTTTTLEWSQASRQSLVRSWPVPAMPLWSCASWARWSRSGCWCRSAAAAAADRHDAAARLGSTGAAAALASVRLVMRLSAAGGKGRRLVPRRSGGAFEVR